MRMWLALAATTAPLLVRCGLAAPPQRCPELDQEVWRERIVAYLDHTTSRDLRGKSRQVRLEGGEHYADIRVGIWSVPFRIGSERYLALISCDGSVELSRPSASMPSPVY